MSDPTTTPCATPCANAPCATPCNAPCATPCATPCDAPCANAPCANAPCANAPCDASDDVAELVSPMSTMMAAPAAPAEPTTEPVSAPVEAEEDADHDHDPDCDCGNCICEDEDSPEEIKRKAEKMLAEMPEEHREGLRDLFELARCIGMPAARALLMSAAPFGATLPAAEVASRIAAATPFDCEGSIQIDFVDQRNGVKSVANIYAAPASRTHDFGRAIAPLRAAVPDDRWEHVAKNFSNLILYVRTQLMSAATTSPHSAALAACGGALTEVVRASAAGRLAVQVDPTNFTMFLHPDWPRIGIFVGGATPGTMFE